MNQSAGGEKNDIKIPLQKEYDSLEVELAKQKAAKIALPGVSLDLKMILNRSTI